MKTYSIPANTLRSYCIAILQNAGIPEDEAYILSDNLVSADLRGIPSHGVSKMSIYMKSLELGLIRKKSDWKIVTETDNTMVIDGNNSIGAVTGTQVMQKLLKKAEHCGIVMASIGHSTHFGMSAYYSMMALPNDMIGCAVTNAPPAMAPWGGVEPILGTNPISYAIPAYDQLPIVADLATSVVAKGKIIMQLDQGGVIPSGWALDRDCIATTDARKAIEGTVMPIGGPKGFALSLFVDILSSCLSGGASGKHVRNLYNTFDEKQETCHNFTVINISKFIPVDIFKRKVDALILEIKGSQKAPSTEELYLPGELEFCKQKQFEKTGVPVSELVKDELEELADRYGVGIRLG
jgi:LDH2 family malate/lactate/ureidoglycolate dehydrogenase